MACRSPPYLPAAGTRWKRSSKTARTATWTEFTTSGTPTHTTLLGSVTLPTLFQNPANSTIGPYYSHFTNFTPNVDAVFIDDFNIVATVAVPEPTSLALLGVGATCLRRRRRH